MAIPPQFVPHCQRLHTTRLAIRIAGDRQDTSSIRHVYLRVAVPVPLGCDLVVIGGDLLRIAILMLPLQGLQRSHHPRKGPLLGLGQVIGNAVAIAPIALGPRIHDGTGHLRLTRLLGTTVDEGVIPQPPVDGGEEVIKDAALMVFQGQRLAGLRHQILLLDDLHHHAVRLLNARTLLEVLPQRLVVPKYPPMLILVALTDQTRALLLDLRFRLNRCHHRPPHRRSPGPSSKTVPHSTPHAKAKRFAET